MKKSLPLLSFEFASSSGVIKPLTFNNPIEIIIANTVEEVLPCFDLIEKAIQDGYYVAGYMSYECAPAFDPAFKVKSGNKMPLVWFGVFNEPKLETVKSDGAYKNLKWTSTVSEKDYQNSIKLIKQWIGQGTTYQTNYTIRLKSNFQGDDITLYNTLKRAQVSNYCAYINTGEYSILSASPELFFHLKEDKIITRPMKGTLKRGRNIKEDEANRNELYYSEKNRAENVMIVDLLRNDLNVIAIPGTVQVDKLFEIEDYPTVHQMTSTITAKIKESTKLLEVFQALFPCGSITGAPKISTMEAIEKLEKEPREVYCGAIGYITPEREAIFNVPIRTVVIDQQTNEATYGVGGGITWDSTSEDEYQEVLAKASLLEIKRPEFQLLESLLLENGEYFLIEEHLNRLFSSAKYFKYPINMKNVKNHLQKNLELYQQGTYKTRLLMNLKGEVTITTQPITLQSFDTPVLTKLADEPVSKNNIFLYHKTTNRDVYTQFQKSYSDVFDVLLWNEDRELTEFTNGNIVLEMADGLWTPPIESGLLAGTYRERLLKEGRIKEKILTIEDLKNCTNIWFVNSVRKWVKVKLI
ncbi:aminodeoxychorismate synthase, component I [Lysinibacillus sp. PLM2]|nr:aminodeoxychorismate synthase, component I [Lysinibacillus sp. PLM2]